MLTTVVLATAWFAIGGSEGGTTASADEPMPAIVVAAVDAAGVAAGPAADWAVVREDVGRYRVTFPAPTTLAVQTWTAPATVTATPRTPETWVVTFLDDTVGAPVDAAFSFLASPAP